MALPAAAQEQAPTVSTAIVRAQTWQPSLEAVGSLRAARGADLAAELPGIVDWVGFDSGRDVEAGTLLLRLRPNDDAAKLAELQAAADLAASNLARDTKQYKAQAVSQATIDADDSHLRAARAQVAQQQAIMAERLVRAPFAGRLGLRQVDVGQYLPAGTMVVTLQALDPIYVDFYVPQQALGAIRIGQLASLRVDTFPGHVFGRACECDQPEARSGKPHGADPGDGGQSGSWIAAGDVRHGHGGRRRAAAGADSAECRGDL